ncbi:MAG TPA: hypothetical protein P5556_05335 [Candidatus Gastranaerophilales bacterium]|nr:hypothetical protein [Candidatus Gastranaerophilales bacterium]
MKQDLVKKNIDNIIISQKNIWSVFLLLSAITILLIFNLNNSLTIFFAATAGLIVLILLFIYIKKSTDLLANIDDLFNL